MIKNEIDFNGGFAQIFVLISMLLVAVSLPIATVLVQQNQENRSQAASTNNSSYVKCSSSSCSICTTSSTCSSVGCYWETLTKSCSKKTANTDANCIYTCTSWGNCTADSSSASGASQTCLSESKSNGDCTGGTKKIGTTRNCNLNSSDNPKCGVVKNSCSFGVASGYQLDSITGVARWNCILGKTAIDCSYNSTSSCSSSGCSKCSQSECINTKGCNWGYNGSSSMYCYSETSVLPTVTKTPSDCNSSTNGNTKCQGGNVYRCFYDTSESTSGWGLYRDCGGSGCINGLCNNAECHDNEKKCLDSETLQYCSNGKFFTIVCGYGCFDNNCDHGCVIGGIECRNGILYQCGLDGTNGHNMQNTGISCLGYGDKIFYGADLPKGWQSNRNREKNPLPAGTDLTQYQAELMRRINEAGGPGTRGAVVAAALYLAEEFPYTIPYESDGGESTDKNNIITTPGFQLTTGSNGQTTYTANWNDKTGFSCLGFVQWAYRAAGYDTGFGRSVSKQNVTNDKNNVTVSSNNNTPNKNEIIETIKVGDIVYTYRKDGAVHMAIITGIDYASGTVQIVQSSSGAGVNIGYVDLFSLDKKEGTNSERSFDYYTHVDDSYFDQEPGLL